MAFNLNVLNFNQLILNSQGRILNTWADILKKTNLEIGVMHERNTHNFSLDLAAVETGFSVSVKPVGPTLLKTAISDLQMVWLKNELANANSFS